MHRFPRLMSLHRFSRLMSRKTALAPYRQGSYARDGVKHLLDNAENRRMTEFGHCPVTGVSLYIRPRTILGRQMFEVSAAGYAFDHSDLAEFVDMHS